MLEELDGRVAVVTGAASGIGLAMSEAFLAEGMQVVLTVWKKLCRSDAPRAERPPGPAVYGPSKHVA